MKFKKEMLLLYAVTDRHWTGRQTLEEQIEEALAGGVTILQLREKNLPEEEFLQEAIRVKEICHRHGVPLIINDNVEVALKSGADGVHVGIEDAPVSEIRARVPADFIIGATCKTVEQAKKAEQAGADYMGVGPYFHRLPRQRPFGLPGSSSMKSVLPYRFRRWPSAVSLQRTSQRSGAAAWPERLWFPLSSERRISQKQRES